MLKSLKLYGNPAPGIPQPQPGRPAPVNEEQRIILGFSLMILVAGNFLFKYIGHSFFSNGYLDITSPGFWLIITNALFITSILLLNKKDSGWKWSELGFCKPAVWWQPVVATAGIFAAVLLLSQYIQPFFMDFGTPPDISHLFVLQGNLPMLILALVLVWTISAFLEELVFRAFLINGLDLLLGRNSWSPWAAVLISSLIFGLMHAWQGIGGIMTTACVGLIFGIAYLLNGRRLLAIILAHGIIDTITLVSIYNM